MESALIEFAASQGIWVLLFVSLFIYTIQRYEKLQEKQEAREQEYQKLLQELAQKFSILTELKDDIAEIKNWIKK